MSMLCCGKSLDSEMRYISVKFCAVLSVLYFNIVIERKCVNFVNKNMQLQKLIKRYDVKM